MNQQEHLQLISKYFSRFSEQVSILNSNGEFSINIHAENVLIKILNIIFESDFENMNYVEGKNYDSIDLRDKNGKFSIQVTATSSITKIKNTLKMFVKNKHYEKHKKLKILILTGKQKKYSQESIDKVLSSGFTFNVNTNIIDFKDLYLFLSLQNNLSKINGVKNLLESQFSDLITRDSASESSGIFLDKRDRIRYQNKYNKFDYKYGYLDFVGREEEMLLLFDFIGKVDDAIKFQWWMVTGPGGMGKSRIAQELCFRLKDYYSGFYDLKTNPDLTTWYPNKPTLIVIDYALSRIQKTIECVSILSQKSCQYHYPVRLLLLERNETLEWLEKLRPGTELNDTLYRPSNFHFNTKLELKPLSEEDRWKIIEQVITSENALKWNYYIPKKEEILKKLNELDKKCRPLFTFLVAMALSHEDNIRYWNTNDLLENTLARFEDIFKKYTSPEIENKTKLILFINTLCGNLTASELGQLLFQIKDLPIYGDFKKIYLIISEYNVNEGIEYWGGLQPDILGEYYLLKTVNAIVQHDPVNGRNIIKKVLKIAWELRHEEVTEMCFRMWSDFQIGSNKIELKFDIINCLFEQISSDGSAESKSDLGLMFGSMCAVYYENKNYNEAEKHGDLAVLLNSNHALVFNNRGAAKTELKKLDEAIIDFDKGIELDPDIANLYYNKGRVKRELKQYSEAVNLFDKAIALNENYMGALNDRGLVKYYLQDYENALVDLNKAISIEPWHTTYNNRGLVNRELKKYDEAINDYNLAIELNENDHLAYFNRAITLLDTNKLVDALNDLNKAIELNSKDPDYFGLRGVVKKKLGNKTQSTSDLEKAARMGDINSRNFLSSKTKYIKSKDRYSRNERISVRYTNGQEKINIKYKYVADDINSFKCIVIN